MDNIVFPPSEAYNEVLHSEMELDAIADELSKQCAALVLEEPITYFTTEANGFFGPKRIESSGQGDGVINTANNGRMFPHTTLAVYDTKNQILEDEEEDTGIGKENTLGKDSTKGIAIEDGCSGRRGTGVFIPNATHGRIPAYHIRAPISGRTRAYNYQNMKVSDRDKKTAIYINKDIVENPTKSSDQVASEFSLPQEWPYEY